MSVKSESFVGLSGKSVVTISCLGGFATACSCYCAKLVLWNMFSWFSSAETKRCWQKWSQNRVLPLRVRSASPSESDDSFLDDAPRQPRSTSAVSALADALARRLNIIIAKPWLEPAGHAVRSAQEQRSQNRRHFRHYHHVHFQSVPHRHSADAGRAGADEAGNHDVDPKRERSTSVAHRVSGAAGSLAARKHVRHNAAAVERDSYAEQLHQRDEHDQNRAQARSPIDCEQNFERFQAARHVQPQHARVVDRFQEGLNRCALCVLSSLS